MTKGATAPRVRRPAKNVVVFQWLEGTEATIRAPHSDRPGGRVMWVFARVFVEKDEPIGVEACSAALRTFF